ncbi:retrotransposon protein, putative, ty1-copia subclass [Tanacetum coccineum]|uniref:Retrotransposon protein, putative, ty1-copia subclass n=1 Tax=Tanacetum coccineum TaxID=301880 RepID=A0ABQ5G470_9ASTR
MIDSRLLPKGDLKTRWIRYVPNKVNTFAWKVMTNSLPTRFNISRRGIDIESLSCVNCDVGIETNDHLFFACNTAKKISKLINRWWDVPFMDINRTEMGGSWIDNVKMRRRIIMSKVSSKYEKNIKFVEQPTGPAPDPETVDPDTINKYYEAVNLEQEVACLMLSSMSPDLQRTLEKYNAYDMLKELKTMFEEQAKQVMFKIVKAFHACKQEKGQSVSSYLLKMKSYVETLERLGYDMPNKLGVSLILNSLNKVYDQFVQNYNMHSMGKTIVELHAMLKHHEKGIPKKAETPDVLAIREGKIQKDKKNPRGAKSKDKGNNKLAYGPKPKISPPPKRDNPERTLSTTTAKRESRKLKHEALSLYMGNGMRAVVEAIRSFDLILPSGLIIFYVNVSNKRSKHALNSSYLWHCHLGHINKKRMDKFKRDKILPPIHDESLKKCKSCISRKMARKPFPHQLERAKDLLGLIHTDVCGPFRTVSREGVSYFITFTDDFSRYDYVYLMKHKLEIKAIRSNRGGEYLSLEFVNHMKSCGIVSQLTPPYTPQHNVVPERRNRTLLDMVQSMINLTTLPKSFWGYALKSAARILNMVPTKKFFENNLMVQEASGSHELLKMSGSDEVLELIQEEDTKPFENTSKVHNEVAPIKEYELGDLNEPPNYKAALSDPEFDKWLEAMNTEMQSMKDNQVWVLVDLPPNGRTVRSKWLFKKKTDMDGNVHTFKARLVAKGYTQTYGVDYGETFSPVADIRAIRILLAIAAFYDYEIWQMDVKTAFLNGHLSEDVYMVQPEGFVDPKHPNKVCKLQRSIYGLKQASRSWNKRFDVEIKKIGFTQNPDEPCVYLKASGSNVAFLHFPNPFSNHW